MINHPKNGVNVKIFNKMKIKKAEKDSFQNVKPIFPRLFNQLAATTEVITRIRLRP